MRQRDPTTILSAAAMGAAHVTADFQAASLSKRCLAVPTSGAFEKATSPRLETSLLKPAVSKWKKCQFQTHSRCQSWLRTMKPRLNAVEFSWTQMLRLAIRHPAGVSWDSFL